MTLKPRTIGDVRQLEEGPGRRRNLVEQYDRALVDLAKLHDREVETARDAEAALQEHRRAREAYDRKVLSIRELRRSIVSAVPEPPLTGEVEKQQDPDA